LADRRGPEESEESEETEGTENSDIAKKAEYRKTKEYNAI